MERGTCTAPAERVFLGRQESPQPPPRTASTHTRADPGEVTQQSITSSPVPRSLDQPLQARDAALAQCRAELQHKEPPLGDEDEAAGDPEHSCSPEIPRETEGNILPGEGKTSGLSTAVSRPGSAPPVPRQHFWSWGTTAGKAQKEDE